MKLLLFLLFSISLYAQSSITPIPKTLSYSIDQALLGKKLFEDPTLSRNGSISCASCHDLNTNGASSTQYSFGVDGKETKLNAPTVFNSIFNFVQFHDGRAKDLKEQIVIALAEKSQMDMVIDDVLKRLENSEYKQEFAKVFKQGLNRDNFLQAIVEFQKALITPNSRFDQYLRGDTTVLSSQEKQGYKEFQNSGCISCHNGVNIGSSMYQKLGIFVPFKANKFSNGRFDITKRERDKFVYKVASLRNIEHTAPYFHDGSAKDLQSAVKRMYEHQLGLQPTSSQINNIVAFLKTLSAPKPKILEGNK